MKNLNLNPQVQQIDSAQNSESVVLEFNDVVVYQEMADQPAVRLNLIQQVHLQMNQLDEMLSRKQYLVQEIFREIVK